MKISAADTLDIPIRERIQLVADIWESIAEFPDEIELSGEMFTVVLGDLEHH